MSEQKPSLSKVPDSLNLYARIATLEQQLHRTQQENTDLKTLLATLTQQTDLGLAQARQERADLEYLLAVTTEHSSLIESELETQVDTARQQVEAQFRLIAETVPIGILITHFTTSNILYANEMAETLLGLPVQALLKRKALDFYANPTDRQSILAILSQTQYFRGELQVKRADGVLGWMLLSVCPFVFQEETTILTALADITDRKQAEENLKNQVRTLQIEVDQQRCDQEVNRIVQTGYFQQLLEQVDSLRYLDKETRNS